MNKIKKWTRKPSSLSEVKTRVSIEDIHEIYPHLPHYNDIDVWGERKNKEDDIISEDFIMEVPQVFLLYTRVGIYLVDTQGSHYPRYVAEVIY